MNDEWDLVSDAVPSDSATDPSDTVSTPQPPTRRRRVVPDDLITDDVTSSQQEAPVIPPRAPYEDAPETSPARQVFISAPWLKKAVIFGVVILLILAGSFGVFQGIRLFHNANVVATAPAEVGTTATTYVNATATAQAVATATTLKQIYTQATSGTPAVDDPLSDDRNGWDVVSNSWGGQCTFTGGAYHLILPKPGYVIVCTDGSMSALKNSANFALQVQINIMQGNDGDVFFGNASYGSYGVNINSLGTYSINQYVRSSDQVYTLKSSSSSAIKAGLNQINVITIVVNNKNLYLYINGQFITTANMSNYSQGDGGFDTRGIDQAADVAFSNLKVWTL